MSDDSFAINLFIQIINYIRPGSFEVAIQRHQTTPVNSTRPHRRNRRNYRRGGNRYRLLNLENNYIRGSIVLRARQITQRNRIIAAQAEQELVNAILQAREEREFFLDRVPSLRTQNERPPRPVGQASEPEENNTNNTAN